MTRVTNHGRSRFWLRLFAWMAGGLLVLFLMAAAVLYFLVPKDKIIARVVPLVESGLKRRVHLEDAGISIWPPFGVYLAGLRVEDSLATEDLLRIDHLRAQLAWRPLLSGELRFSSLSISGLFFHYEQFDDSTSNLTDLLAGPSRTYPVLVERLEFDGVKLSGADKRDTSAWMVDGLAAHLTIDMVTLDFELGLSIPQVQTRHADSVVVYNVPITLSALGQAQRNPLAVTVRELEGSIGEVPLRGRAQFDKSPSGSVDAQLTLGPATVSQVLDLLPAARRQAALAYEISGNLEVAVEARGPLDSLSQGGARVQLTWTEGRIADSTGEWVHFASLVIPVDNEGFHVDADQVVTRFGPVRLAAVGSWPPENRLELSVVGQSQLATFFRPDTAGVAGHVEWSASAYGPMTDPKAWQLGARAALSEVRFEEASREPFLVDEGVVTYDGELLKLEHLRARYGRSDAQLEGVVMGVSWRAYMSQQALSPDLALHVRSQGLDLDALFPHLAGDSAAPADTIARPPLPAGRARLVVDADTLWLGGAVWNRVHGEFTLAGNRCIIDTLYGRVYGGRVQLAGHIDSVTSQPAYAFQLAADSMEVGDLLGRFGAMGRHLRGKSQLSASLAGRGQTAAEVASALMMNGTVKLFDARLEQLNVAGRIQELLGLTLQDPLPIKSVVNHFRFEQGRAMMEDFKFTTPRGTWTLGGSAGLDGTLSYRLAARMSPEQAAQVKLPESWTQALPAEMRGRVDPIDLLKDDEGAIDLFFLIGGHFKQPDVAVDWEKLQPRWKARFESLLKEKLSAEAEKKLKEGLKGLLDQFKR